MKLVQTKDGAAMDTVEQSRIEKLVGLLQGQDVTEDVAAEYVNMCLVANEGRGSRRWFTDEINKRNEGRESWDNVPTLEQYEAENAHRVRLLLESSGIPRDLRDMTFDKVKPRQDVKGFAQGLDACKRFTVDIKPNMEAGRGLTLLGDPGLFKSGLSSLVAKAAISEGVETYFVSAARMFEALKPGDDSEDYIESLLTVPLLIIDDLGNEYRTEYSLYNLDLIISGRHSEMLSTIITSNYYRGEFAKAYAPRIIDRLRERNQEFEFRGSSYRQRGSHD